MFGKIFSFDEMNWLTPNTYGNNFSMPPKKSGVYLIVKPIPDFVKNEVDYEILYVGSSKNLLSRYHNHEKIRECDFYVQFYFKEEADYIAVEKALIKLIQPKMNKQWR